jgi:uncharacterized membrane protein YphA (DoxX/SURF4 family)
MSQQKAEEKRWPLARRVAFRVLFIYVILIGLPMIVEVLPGAAPLLTAYNRLQQSYLPWVGKHVLRLRTEFTVQATGSGDRIADHIEILCFFALAAVATLLWSVLDKRSLHHEKLQRGLRVYIRYILGATMIIYGMAKVWKTQFPFPAIEQMMNTYGNSSPMRLLWNFMGYSTGYNIFTGGAEVLGGLLLFFRRTTTLGALVVAAVMANVVMLNFCYDVPVKLYSLHWLLLAVLLLLPDLRRLADLLVLNRPTEAVTLRTPFQAQWLEKARVGGKALLIGSILFWYAKQALDMRKMMSEAPGKLPFFGLYEVEGFVRNGAEVSPLITETTRWRTVAVNSRGTFTIRLMDDTQKRYRPQQDPEKHEITFATGSADKASLTYAVPDPDHVVLTGTYMNDALSVRLRKVESPPFLLANRGFHWINEVPYNL